MRRFLVITLILLGAIALRAQDTTSYTQTIRGTIVDAESSFPIIGATVVVITSTKQFGGLTNEKGEFIIQKVPIGRHSIRIMYTGYHDIAADNVLVTSGKQVVLNLKMDEKVIKTEEVVVEFEKSKKSETLNQNTSVSGRQFSIEETSRYAASRNDPARMAMNFAGVAQGDDSRNDIIIRGNSPLGIQYRMDGIPMPNPNHFGSFGTTGGPVSILNNNVLDNSDFLTGAFPAEFGNVLAGVFDLQMRKGNNKKFEGMGQIGFNGLEGGAEGPFKKDGSSSYLLNYRFSTLEIFDALGISFGTAAIPEYQDLSFKVFVPTEKLGDFSLFGLGGASKIELLGSTLSEDDLFSERDDDVVFNTATAISGLTHKLFLGEKSTLRTNVAVSAIGNKIVVDSLTYDSNNVVSTITPDYRNHFRQVKYTFNTNLNVKFNSRNNITTGWFADIYYFNLVDSALSNTTSTFFPIRDFVGATALLRGYIHWQHKFSDKVTLNTGFHAQYLRLNESFAPEPRLGLRYFINDKSSLNFGTGLYSQIQPFQAYFLESEISPGVYETTNENLDFTKAFHIVGGYQRALGTNWNAKIELYYQYLYSAPVETTASFFSLLNSGADFGVSSEGYLTNEGTGFNYGLELTLEKYYSKGFYMLFTTSLYDSKYKGSDGVLRNSAFNGNYVVNMLAGKELKLGKKTTLGIDAKLTFAGGKRFVPIDIAASNLAGFAVYDEANAYEGKLAAYFRPDIKVLVRKNGKKVTQEWALDVQNVIGRQNVFSQEYSSNLMGIQTNYQLGLFPVVQYRILF